MVKNENTEIVTRLNTMIALLTENMMASGLVGKIRAMEILQKGGLTTTEIGKIVGLPAPSVSSMLSRKKKKRTKTPSRK